MARLLAQIDAPSTLGSFLRAFTFGHIRQLDAVAARFLVTLAKLTGVFAASPASHPGEAGGGYAWVDVDDTVVEVHGHAKQGAGFGYNRIRGLNALLATLTRTTATTGPGSTASGPVIVAQRLRKGACNSSRGAKRLVADATKTARRLLGRGQPILVRMDSALYGRGPRHRCSPLRRRVEIGATESRCGLELATCGRPLSRSGFVDKVEAERRAVSGGHPALRVT
jgi:hypothetical protein